MTKYKYYNLSDKNKETVGIVESDSLFDATILASQIKRMPLDKFNEVFGVEKFGNDERKQSRTKKTI